MMFDMKIIGRKIAMLRKEKNLTQMELADKLNISYQAVSNWERGETMPDISKLPEIAQIFNIPIDEILGNQHSTKIIENIIEDNLIKDKITVEEFKSVAPLLKPTQVSEVSKGIDNINDIDDMIEYLPFISREIVDKIAQKSIDNNQILLDDFLPFVSREYADKLVLKAMEKDYTLKDLTGALPFVSKEVADKIAQKITDNDLILLGDILPFVSREYADKFASRAIEEDYTLKDLADVIPFVSKEVADKIINNRY
jgi:transcriptional regulator with XRE-family HTH domain